VTSELAFIEAMRALATHPAARGLFDDCAVVEFGNETLILTHDMLVEGVHFLPGQDPADIAWKLVAANISDLAAKGARVDVEAWLRQWREQARIYQEQSKKFWLYR
jgi:thiamine-monophosphate kinase